MLAYASRMILCAPLALCVVVAAAADEKSDAGSARPLDPRAQAFESLVRPILVNRCEECHADDPEGGLRVDSRAALLLGGRSGAAIVPGDPDASLLIQSVRHTHAQLKMPKKRARLAEAEIAALDEWVREGAYWPEARAAASASPEAMKIGPDERAFWSFQPLGDPRVPDVFDCDWPRCDIDRFVLARLEHEGLAPVAPADKRTLLRRATLDLTGVVPTPEEVEAFLADEDRDAFEKVVDRLLASPRYGETWGRWWLDVARFGEDDCRSLDPKGRGYSSYPNAYLYRDWVVKSFNEDLPYDAFVRAQLAADLTSESTRVRDLPALGFLGLGPWYYDNGSVEVTRADERNDRVDAVTRGFLGLTVACARCHDHKYDPISTRDFHALAGVFLNTRYREYAQAPQSVVDEYKTAEKKIKDKEKLLREFMRTESKQLSQTLALQASKYMRSAWRVLGEPKRDKARVADEDKLDYELFDRWLAFLVKPQKHYPYLKDWQDMIARGGKKAEAAKLADVFQSVLTDVLFEHLEIEEENEVIRAKALPGTKKKERAELPSDFVTNDDFCPGCGLELKGLSTEKANLWTDAFERDLDSNPSPVSNEEDASKPGLFAFGGWGLERQLGADRRRYLDDLRTDIAALRKALPPKYPYVHGVEDVPKPEPIRVHVRGSPFKLGEEVPRRFLEVLGPGAPEPFTAGSGRQELAEAIVRHPLAIRVFVNRVWKQHFGSGIVDTPSNFGVRGERPTHPELLEHLARRFVAGGLSLKKLQREILLTATYRLGDHESEVAWARDPDNRLHWRASTRRLTAEQIRDSMLLVSGVLDTKLYGPSEKLTPASKRRTLYGTVSRYKLDPYLALFDFPSPNATSERRFTTQVPLQRLFFMNSDFVQRQSELLATRAAVEFDEAARVQRLYSLVFQRPATDAEVDVALSYVRAEPMKSFEERKAERESKATNGSAATTAAAEPPKAPSQDDAKDAEGPDSAAGLMAGVGGTGAKSESLEPPLPVTVWGRYAKVLLGSNEFLFVR